MNRAKFIENLTEARKSRELTQKQVAQALGISDKTYSKWETGENEPDIDSLCRLGEVFGCGAADFFAEEAPKQNTIRSELETLTRVQAMLRTREIMDEAYDGICDNALYWMRRWSGGDEEAERVWKEPLPTEPAPEDGCAAFCDMGGGFFLRWWDREMNLRLLMLPGEEGDAFLREDGEKLDEVLELLKRARRLLPLLRREPSREQQFFTADFLAKEAGLPVGETETALKDMERFGFCLRQEAETADGGHCLYTSADTRILRAILALAHLLQREMEGRQELLAKRGEKA